MAGELIFMRRDQRTFRWPPLEMPLEIKPRSARNKVFITNLEAGSPDLLRLNRRSYRLAQQETPAQFWPRPRPFRPRIMVQQAAPDGEETTLILRSEVYFADTVLATGRYRK